MTTTTVVGVHQLTVIIIIIVTIDTSAGVCIPVG